MSDTIIEILPKGPIKVSGVFAVQNSKGESLAEGKSTAFLCRCGASKSKPFCDGTHKGVDFDSAGATAE